MAYNQSNPDHSDNISPQEASPHTNRLQDPIDAIFAHPQNTTSPGSHWPLGLVSPEHVSPTIAMAALTLDPFAVMPPGPAPTASPDATIQILTLRVAQLEQQLQAAQQQQHHQIATATVNPAHLAITSDAFPVASSTIMRRPSDHQLRTERREALRKVLNRNGNRCCAWCEPRREPREYGPRQAPENKMTCGCTVEDALFEETLARNGVGSMDTGHQRLDPELRRALLALLQKRYKYRDGDLDFDHETLLWDSGGNAASWLARDRFE